MKGFGFGQETSSPVRLHACILWAGLDLSGSTALARIAFLLLSDPQPAGASRQSIQFRSNPMTSPSRTLPPATAAARIAPLLLALAGLAIAAGSQWLWRHRRQIGAALVTAVATTYAAVAWLRQHVEALATDAARRLPSQPVAAVAPITATLAAAWGLADRVTTAQAKRSQWARLRPRLTQQPNAAKAHGLELHAPGIPQTERVRLYEWAAATAGRWSNDA